MLYDSKKNSGWLVMGMKNLRLRKGIKKEVKEKEKAANQTGNGTYSDSDAAKDVDWLKSTVVNEKNMVEIKKKIKLTSAHRKKLLNDMSIDPLELFPYFFTNPNLVSPHQNKRTIYIFT